MRLLLSGLALVVLGACQPGIPESGAGAGFENYEDRARRDVALEGSSIPPVSAVSQGPITDARQIR